MTTHHRHARRGVWGLLLLLVAVPVGAAEPAADNGPTADKGPAADALPRLDAEAPRPAPITPPSTEEIDAAIRRGVDFLVGRQNPNGSWGSARNTKDLNIYAPVPGAHQAFRAAVTALCISALIESGDRRGRSRRRASTAARRGCSSTCRSCAARRPTRSTTPGATPTGSRPWSSMYRRHADDPADARARSSGRSSSRSTCSAATSASTAAGATTTSNAQTQKPSGSTISFVTATVLVALDEAKADRRRDARAAGRARDGLDPPAAQARLQLLLRRVPQVPADARGSTGRAAASGRSQACNLAMRLWGDKEIDRRRCMRTWLDRLFARNLWLDIGRKRPIPHESWFQVAGYFFYYGHYYAAAVHRAACRRPNARTIQDHLAHVLLRLAGEGRLLVGLPAVRLPPAVRHGLRRSCRSCGASRSGRRWSVSGGR